MKVLNFKSFSLTVFKPFPSKTYFDRKGFALSLVVSKTDVSPRRLGRFARIFRVRVFVTREWFVAVYVSPSPLLS